VARLRSWIGALCKAMALVGALAVLFMVVAVTYEVVMRYAFNRPTSWSNEYVSYALVAAAFLPAGYCLSQDGHVKVDFVVSRLSVRKQAKLKRISALLILVFSIVFTWITAKLAWQAYLGHWVSVSSLQVYLFPIYLLIPVGGFCLFLQSVADVCKTFKGSSSNSPVESRA